MGKVQNRQKLEIIQRDDNKSFFKKQSILIFNGIHEPYQKCDGKIHIRKNEVLMDKPISSGFAILELSK